MPDRDPGTLRVVHVVPSLNVAGGGPARSVLRLAAAQQRLGASACVVTGNEGEAGPDVATAETAGGVTVRRCRHLPLPFEVPAPGMARVLTQEIREADVAHLHSLWNGTITLAAHIARRRGVPYVVSPRGMLDPVAVRRKRPLKRLYRWLVDAATSNRAAGFHFLTQDERDTAVWRPGTGQRIAVIPNGIEADATQRAAASFSPELFPDGGPNLLYLGRLHPTKGLALQVDVLALLKERGLDARLYLVGPDDGEAERLKQRARSAAVAERMHVLGPDYSDRRLALLKAADCVLLTSHFEGNSVSAMETLAVGGLLVATDTTHLDEAARHDAAIVVARKASAVADAVERIWRNPELGRSLRQAAAAYARAELQSEVIARRMLSFYDEVLGITFASGARA